MASVPPESKLQEPQAASGRCDENPDAAAVRGWLEDFVMRLDFCPWARTADAEGGIRIVTSDSSTVDGVLSDLQTEAAALRDGDRSSARTTLVVCPNVEAWRDFRFFHAFFVWQLDNGFSLEEYGVKVVPFHPRYALESELRYRAGDGVVIPSSDGRGARGTVLEEFVGFDADKEPCLSVMLDGGQEVVLRHAALLAKSSTLEAEGEVQHFSSRAPRPVLHLLRNDDMEKAVADAGGDTEDLINRNEFKLQQLGARGAERLMRKFG